MPPKRARSSPSPPVVVSSDSDSDKPKPKVAPTSTRRVASTRVAVSPKSKPAKKWQSSLVDFATLNKPKTNSAGPSTRKLGKSKSMTASTTQTPVKHQVHFSSPVNKRTASTSKKLRPGKLLHSSPAKPPPSPSSSEVELESPVQAGKSSKLSEIDPPGSTDIEGFHSDEDAEPSPTKRVKRRVSRMVTSDEDEQEDSKPPQESDDEDEEAPVVARSKRRANGKGKAVAVSSTDEEEEGAAGRKRRLGLKRGKRREAQDSEEEVVRDSQEEEEDDPMDGLDDNLVLDSRLRSAPQRNTEKATLRENLARLKRRKLGVDTPPVQKSESESESEEEEVDRPRGRRVVKVIPGARPTQPTLENWIDAPASGSDSESDGLGEKTLRRSTSASNDDGNDSDLGSLESWIEDDEGTNTAMLPEGFSMRGHQSLKDQFKVVMEMFVHLACLKAKERKKFRNNERNDQHYGLSLRALRRKLDGLRDSLVTSSVWTTEFKEALNTHPVFSSFHLDFAVPGCGACRISSRLSTYRGDLSGDDYDRDTFEPIPARDPSVGSEDSENESATAFDLGRFCRARVQCYHDFVHWEWQLFERTADEIEVLRTANRRNDPTQAQRPAANDPAGILNWLDRRGIVQQEWARLEELMDAARGLDSAFRKGDEDE